jgi:hypothetical protein
MKYRVIASSLGLLAVASVTSAYLPSRDQNPAAAAKVTVFKDPNCGCCRQWVEHLRKHSFVVTSRDTSDLSGVKRTGRVPERLHSCHTAFVDGYVIEGHVPAADVQRMLKERPKIAGIAVPGMPVGSPGMEVGARKDPYDVIAFDRDGTSRVFARH